MPRYARPSIPIVVGIDAGGTTTRLVAQRAGRRWAVSAGPGNFITLGREGFSARLRAGAASLAAKTRTKARDVAAVCLGGAGLGRDEERAAAAACLRAVWPRARSIVTDDATLFLRAVFGERPGVVLIAGTGSICLGQDASGRRERAGGFGPLLGDPGSAFALGRQALLHLLSVRDGLLAPTPFAAALARRLGLADPRLVLTRVAQGGPAFVASLGPFVLERPRRNDEIAGAVVRIETAALARLATTVAGRLDLRNPTVAFGGGLARARAYAAAVRDAIERQAPGARCIVSRRQAVDGALALATGLLESNARPGQGR